MDIKMMNMWMKKAHWFPMVCFFFFVYPRNSPLCLEPYLWVSYKVLTCIYTNSTSRSQAKQYPNCGWWSYANLDWLWIHYTSTNEYQNTKRSTFAASTCSTMDRLTRWSPFAFCWITQTVLTMNSFSRFVGSGGRALNDGVSLTRIVRRSSRHTTGWKNGHLGKHDFAPWWCGIKMQGRMRMIHKNFKGLFGWTMNILLTRGMFIELGMFTLCNCLWPKSLFWNQHASSRRINVPSCTEWPIQVSTCWKWSLLWRVSSTYSIHVGGRSQGTSWYTIGKWYSSDNMRSAYHKGVTKLIWRLQLGHCHSGSLIRRICSITIVIMNSCIIQQHLHIVGYPPSLAYWHSLPRHIVDRLIFIFIL